VELVPSAPLLQLVPLPDRRRPGGGRVLDLDHREDTLRYPVIGRIREAARPHPGGPDVDGEVVVRPGVGGDLRARVDQDG